MEFRMSDASEHYQPFFEHKIFPKRVYQSLLFIDMITPLSFSSAAELASAPRRRWFRYRADPVRS